MSDGDYLRMLEDHKRIVALEAALKAIADALDVPRDRLGRLKTDWVKMDALRNLAIAYKVGSCEDTAEQCVKVARAALAKAGQQ